jgi:hypothetical protein
LTLNGNSATNRLLVTSNTLGTPTVLTCTGATVSTNNIDLRDIAFRPALATGLAIASVTDNAGEAVFTTTSAHRLKVGDKITITGFSGGNAGYNGNKTIAVAAAATTFETTDNYVATGTGAWTYDLTNNGANLIGDCGGNSGATFTTATTTTCIGNTGVWSTRTWDVRAPLPQDTVVISLTAGQTLTTDMPRLGKNISFGTATNLTLGSAITSYGSLNLTGMGTLAGAYIWYFESQARSGTNTLTGGGKSFPGQVAIQGVGATLQLADALSVGAGNSSFYVYNGTFTDAGFSVTAFSFQSAIANTRAVTKTGNWTVTASSVSTVINLIATGITWSDTAGTITVSDTGANAKTFAGAGKIFNDVSFPSGTGGVIITGSNTFNNMTVAAGGKLVVTAGTQQNVNSFTAVGTSANHITLASATPGTPFTMADANGSRNLCTYLDVTDSAATPANSWYYGWTGTGDTYSKANGWKSIEPAVMIM